MSERHASLFIRHARILDPASNTDLPCDLLIEKGFISHLGPDLAASDLPSATRTIDASGCWLLPGLVDIGAPAMTADAIAAESRAAASGGVSHLAVFSSQDMTIDNMASLRLLREKAAQSDLVRLLPIAALTRELKGEQLVDMHTLSGAGAIAFSNAQQPVASNLILKRCMEYAATFDFLVTFCPQDHDLSAGGCAHEGSVASRLGLPGIPNSAETLALARALLLAEETGTRIHVHQLSSASSLPLLKTARQQGVQVTADVSIHHLLADESAINNFDSRFHLLPPLRRKEDREALLAAVADGTIDAVCSQHTPLASADKQQPFGSTRPGIAAVETLLPLLLKLVQDKRLPLMRAVDAATRAPARCMTINAGHLRKGEKASLCLVDPERQLRPMDHWQSTGKNSPWLDTLLPGQVRLTVSEGRITWMAKDQC
jgi:dihydroorotase